jgi:hypothetical protein
VFFACREILWTMQSAGIEPRDLLASRLPADWSLF